jgi:hypothetical protein
LLLHCPGCYCSDVGSNNWRATLKLKRGADEMIEMVEAEAGLTSRTYAQVHTLGLISSGAT